VVVTILHSSFIALNQNICGIPHVFVYTTAALYSGGRGFGGMASWRRLFMMFLSAGCTSD